MKEKNYWPHAIIGVLLFGVFMVSVSITIAMKNPIQDENTYFAKKRIVDENINEIIKEQTLFHNIYDYKIWLSDEKGIYANNSFIFPYYAPANRPDIKAKIPTSIISPNGVKLHIELHKKLSSARINRIWFYLDSNREADKLQNLGELTNVENNLWESEVLTSLPLGRWKFVIEISYETDIEQNSTELKAYFESPVFIKDKVDNAL
ncbi:MULTISPECIES: hypothetical protein [Helicobacter]|uniref:hypothetical protein n=1 Tax=Helicobacter TaxID=209 RepID=UPI00051DF351|nr:hypothetical protein [Helicobacter sp. MIT 03-1616]TLD90206.1 hypothetical protein LS67_000670 [Helicobacter sp. MIT 03-1616]